MSTPTAARAYRSTVLAARGMVASPHYLASAAGLRVLTLGGNAVDAAIAMTAVLSVVYPHMCGIGGDNFLLIFDARTRRVLALNGSGRAGGQCTVEWYRRQVRNGVIPSRGFLAANTVPGAVDAWGLAHEYAYSHFGGGLPWRDLFDSAIEYAVNGFPVTPNQALWTARNLASDNPMRNLQRFEGFRRVFLTAAGKPYGVGQICRQPELGRTLETIVREGARTLYEGDLARRVTGYLQENGGVLTAADFREHRSDWVDPLTLRYRMYEVVGFPPNTQGIAALMIFGILEAVGLKGVPEGSVEYYHLLVEATKVAFADRDRWVTDPTFLKVPTERLLSPQYLAQRAQLIRRDRAGTYEPGATGADTVCAVAVDAAGNAVSIIQSLYFDFGSAIVAGDTGILLQNRGSFFSLDPGHINRLEPRKRTFHTLIPAMLLQDGRPILVYGTMGGEGQPQTQAALVTRILDYGMDVQEAIEAPRWLYGRTWGAASTDLFLEARIAESVREGLRRRGHPVKTVGEWEDMMGHAQAIQIDPVTGVRRGGADPRGDGLALGY